MAYLIAFALGAIFYRLRGGWWHRLTAGEKPKVWWNGTQAMRLWWAVPTAALMTEYSYGPLWLWPVLALSVFVSQALFGTGQYLRDVEWSYPDLLGFYRNALASIPVFWFAPETFALYSILGSFHASLYYLGFRLRGNADYGDVMLGGLSWVLIVAVQ